MTIPKTSQYSHPTGNKGRKDSQTEKTTQKQEKERKIMQNRFCT